MTEHRALILMYHHVSDMLADPGALAVSPGHFAEQLDVLHDLARPISLRSLGEELFGGTVPPRSVVLTFDDGYRDNLLNAKPLLDQYEIPATVFITAGPFTDRDAFWWDELERVLLHPGALPECLEVPIDGRRFDFHLDGAALDAADAARFFGWRQWEDPPTPRHRLFAKLRQILVAMRVEEQRAIVKDIVQWAGKPRENDVGAHQRLSDDEIVALSSGTRIELGGHTVAHPKLSTLSSSHQSDEILQNKSYLEEMVGAPLNAFAYPYGDFSSETIGIVREAGFACACSVAVGAVQQDADPFTLPRRQVYDWDGETFARWLRDVWAKV